jgi:hypothetical protein
MKKNDCRRALFVRRHAAARVDRPSAVAAKVPPCRNGLPIIPKLSLFIFHVMPKAAFFARWPYRQTTSRGKHACLC